VARAVACSRSLPAVLQNDHVSPGAWPPSTAVWTASSWTCCAPWLAAARSVLTALRITGRLDLAGLSPDSAVRVWVMFLAPIPGRCTPLENEPCYDAALGGYSKEDGAAMP
jgi:hypothetical protein